MLRKYLGVFKKYKVDTLILGCTHYPFLRDRIERILGPNVRVYDPSEPVARRVRQLLEQRDALGESEQPSYRFFTTGEPEHVGDVASDLLGFPITDVGYADI